jgi:hypothetical protein
MSIRHVAKTVAVSAAAVACAGAVSALAFVETAGASPASGSQVGVATPIGSYTAGTPFSSGQIIKVTVPANTIFNNTTKVNILECAAPGGVIPTNTAACDANTIQADTVLPAADGSVSYSNYQLFSLPNVSSLFESPSGQPVCNLANQCVLYIGDNQLDFTQPHYWSQAFVVSPTAGDTGANPGDGTPEVPWAVGLPLAAAGIVGGSVLLRRRRSSRAA